MSIIQAIILAIVEGITEFLPISSTGHLIITSSIMGISHDVFTKLYTVAIQLGAILSVLVLYWKRFLQSFNFYYKILIAFIPAVIFGLLFSKQIDALLDSALIVGIMLLAGGIIFLFVDKWFNDEKATINDTPSYWKALIIGLFQCLAMIPGVSRSAATIIGGLSQKLTRKAAAEFSFFLAVPTMFAATVKKVFDIYKAGYYITPHEFKLLTIGNIIAFIVAMLAIKTFITFLTKHGFKAFGYYRIVAGIVILAMIFFGFSSKM